MTIRKLLPAALLTGALLAAPAVPGLTGGAPQHPLRALKMAPASRFALKMAPANQAARQTLLGESA